MPLDATLADIGSKLREGRFPNERAISQGIVLRILSDLDWNVYDTNIVWPEYSTGEGRVDFALCEPPAKPRVFIEVKQPGGAESGVRQALEYAFHTGVPFIVLTDGKTWSFYLPAEQGSYEERRVFKLDLFERSTGESVDVLRRYLERSGVASGEALEVARKEYRSQNRRSLARKAIPEAWTALIDEEDELLIQRLADSVESKAGIRPEDSDVIGFLSSLRRLVLNEPPSSGSRGQTGTDQPPKEEITVPRRPKTSRRGTLVISGKEFVYGNAKEAVAIVLCELHRADSAFLQRISRHPASRGRKRRYVAQSSEELYPDRPDLRQHHKRLSDNWLLSTYINNRIKKAIVQAAAEVAGLKFGKDIVIELSGWARPRLLSNFQQPTERIWVLGDQQNQRRGLVVWLGTALLPALQRAWRHAELVREDTPGNAELLPHISNLLAR